MTEFAILDQGLRAENGALHHSWFYLRDAQGRVRYRAVALRELTYLPIDTRDDPDMLGKQWAAVRGLYNGEVDFLYTVLGAFQPQPIGVVQFYGAAAEAASEHEAAAEAGRRMAAVEAVLANFPQSRVRPPDLARVQLLLQHMRDLPRILALLGHPDPRLSRRGLGRDGAIGDADDELMAQQGENLLRGLAKLREDFVFLVTAAHIGRGALAEALVRMGRQASQFASRQRGAISTGFSIAIPLATALGSSYQGSHGRADSVGHSQAHTVGEAVGASESQSWSHGVGETHGHGVAHTESQAVTNSAGVTVGAGGAATWGHTDSSGHTDSGSHTASQSLTDSGAHTVSSSHTDSGGHTASSSHTDSGAHTTSSSHTDSAAHTASSSHTDSSAHTASHATGVAHTTGSSWADSTTSGRSSSRTTSAGGSAGHTVGTSAGVAQSSATTDSIGASRTSTQSAGVSQGSSQTLSAGHTEGATAATNSGNTVSSTHSQSNQAGGNLSGSVGLLGTGVDAAASYSHAWVDGTGESTVVGSSLGTHVSDSAGVAAQQSASVSASEGVAEGVSAGQAVSTGQSTSRGVSDSQSVGQSWGTARTEGSFSSSSHSAGGMQATTNSESWGTADTIGSADTSGSADTQGWADSRGVADTRGWADAKGVADTVGWADTKGNADTRGWAATAGTADSAGWATTVGAADSVGGSRTWSASRSSMTAVSRGVADTESWSKAVSESWGEGQSVGRSRSVSRGHGEGMSAAQAVSMTGGRGFSGGLSGGIVPGVSIARSYQTEDDVAIRLTEVARGLESLLNTAAHEGGFMTTALLLASANGERAAQALAPQAFHGPAVPTPVLTVPGPARLREHALAFRPSLVPDADPFGVGLLWTRWGTLLTPAMLAAYTAPNLMEEGTAGTIQEKLPPLAFYPELPGKVVLGHQVSPETGDLTLTPLRLARARHFHTAFCGDTGYGKSVAAVRLAYETTLHWQMKTIVLDFGTGWRQLLNAPGLASHVEIRQLSPGGVRPLRWNPLQIGRNILPEVQWRALADIFGAIAALGQARQIHELRGVLRRLYIQAGVMVDDPECRSDAHWGVVQPGEESLAGALAGTPIGSLARGGRQAVAVARSRVVGLGTLYKLIEREVKVIPARDIRRTMLEGIMQRLQPLVQGEAGLQYGAGPDAIDINAVVPGAWGVAILEGGAFLDDFSKAFLLGWAAWHLYTDAVVRRSQRNVSAPAHMQIFFEEANKMLSGLDADRQPNGSSGGVSTAEQFANMWRDSRKYGIWLHLVTQSPSLIPPGIMSSCNNIFATQLKNARDRDAAIAALARSEKGFVDEPWRRFLASLPVARAVVKLGYTMERAQLEPLYVQPLLLDAREPTDREIAAVLGEIVL